MTARKWNDPKSFAMAVEDFRLTCEANKEPMTHPALSLWLGFADKHSFWEYGETADYGPLVKKAKTMIEADILQRALKTGGAGAIFYLKNLGYTDRQLVSIDPVSIVIRGIDSKL